MTAPTVTILVHLYPTGKPGLVSYEVLSEGVVSPTAEETIMILRQAATHIEENPEDFIEYASIRPGEARL